MSLLLYLLWLILGIGMVIIVWFVIDMLWQTANAQQNVSTAMPNLQISPPSNIQTTPNPNLQYLPQKAFIQAFSPEATPTTQSAILGPLPTNTFVQPQTVSTVPTGNIDVGTIMGIIGTVVAAGSGLMAKMSGDKSKKNEGVIKENSTAIVDSKIVQQELARLMFEWNKTQADALTDSPVTKLENLKNEVKQATDTAIKS